MSDVKHNEEFFADLVELIQKDATENCAGASVGDTLRLCQNYKELQAEAQALRKEVAALRARVVVVDERAEFEAWVRDLCKMPENVEVNWSAQFTQDAFAAWEARARLNGKAVSEGLLRETVRSVDDIFWAIHAKPSCQSGVVARCRCRLCAGTRLAMARDDLNALLGEGNEHE